MQLYFGELVDKGRFKYYCAGEHWAAGAERPPASAQSSHKIQCPDQQVLWHNSEPQLISIRWWYQSSLVRMTLTIWRIEHLTLKITFLHGRKNISLQNAHDLITELLLVCMLQKQPFKFSLGWFSLLFSWQNQSICRFHLFQSFLGFLTRDLSTSFPGRRTVGALAS